MESKAENIGYIAFDTETNSLDALKLIWLDFLFVHLKMMLVMSLLHDGRRK